MYPIQTPGVNLVHFPRQNPEPNKGFTTALFFELLQKKNMEHGTNIRGLVNYHYNQLLKQQGLNEEIPGGENYECLGMDQTTAMSRPDLYYQAYREVLAEFNDHSIMNVCLSTANFLDLHHKNVEYSENLIRGLINHRYNQLLIDIGEDGFIPGGTDLKVLGSDRTTKISHPVLYFKAYQEAPSFIQGLQAWCNKICPEGKHERLKAKMIIFRHYVEKKQSLSLCDMGLTSLPKEIGQLVNLRELTLCRNQLQALPKEIGQLRNLKELHVSFNRLSALPPEMGQLINLQVLWIPNNQLPALPREICRLGNLRNLIVTLNQLTALPPEICRLGNLRELGLSGNQLTALPPEVGQLGNLQKLYLFRNQLRVLPQEMGLLGNLQYLGVFNNQLEALPSCLARLPSSCNIHADENRLSYEAVQIFQDQIALQHELNPNLGPHFRFSIFDQTRLSDNSTLQEIVTFWLTQFQGNFSKDNPSCLVFFREMFDLQNFAENPFYQPLNTLDETQENNLKAFLIGLKKTKDFKHPSTCQPLVFNVAGMLHGACTSEPFREKLFLILQDALSTCLDRTANAFNMIYLQRELLCESKTLDLKKLASLLIGARRLDMVEGIARGLIKEKRLGDEIETLLYFKVELKHILALPVATEGMLYPGASGVTKKDLEEATKIVLDKTTSKEQILEILFSSEEWKEQVIKENKAQFDSIYDIFSGQLEEMLCCVELNDGAKKAATDKIEAAKKEQTNALIAQLTQQWIDEVFLAPSDQKSS